MNGVWTSPVSKEYAELCVQVVQQLRDRHNTRARMGAVVAMCTCGRAAVLCEDNTMLREKGLAPPLDWGARR